MIAHRAGMPTRSDPLDREETPVNERDRNAPEGADLNNGGGNRRDYGPKGCAGIVYRTAIVGVLVMSLLAKAVRR